MRPMMARAAQPADAAGDGTANDRVGWVLPIFCLNTTGTADSVTAEPPRLQSAVVILSTVKLHKK